MRILKWITCLWMLLFSLNCFAAGKALLLNIDGAISPATVDYIKRGLDYAQKNHNPIVILELNTPGGLETAMRSINEAIITSLFLSLPMSPQPVLALPVPERSLSMPAIALWHRNDRSRFSYQYARA